MIRQINQAISTYHSNMKKFPVESDGLSALLKNIENISAWKGPYLEKDKTSDAWGNRYQYEVIYKISSAGKDLKHGTIDDIIFYSDEKP